MAGGAIKYRHLGRKSSHRQALLRNLVTSLFEHESIKTTWPKAKEAQRLADKLITMGKRNTEAARRKAMAVFYEPAKLLPKLFGPLRRRYAERPGGYTRVLRIEPLKTDQSPSAILELVDGPKDMRFAMTAATLARQQEEGVGMNEITSLNVRKVTRFREGGAEELERMVQSIGTKRGYDPTSRKAARGPRELEDLEEEGGEEPDPRKWRRLGGRKHEGEEETDNIFDQMDKDERQESSHDTSRQEKSKSSSKRPAFHVRR